MTETKEAQAVYVVSITNYLTRPKILSHYYMVFANPPTKDDILKELDKSKDAESGEYIQQISNFVEELLVENVVYPGWNSWHINKDNSEVESLECSRCVIVQP